MIQQSTLDIIIVGIAVALVLVAMYTDYRRRIIENSITLPALAAGLLLHLAANGWQGLLFSFLGAVVGFGLMLIPYLLGSMGGGDVKMMAALGALFGAYAVLNIYLYAALIGGIMALTLAISRKRVGDTLKRIVILIKGIVSLGRSSNMAAETKPGIKMPYGIAIGLGALCFIIAGAIV